MILMTRQHMYIFFFYGTLVTLGSPQHTLIAPVGVRYEASAHSVHTFAVSQRLHGDGHLSSAKHHGH